MALYDPQEFPAETRTDFSLSDVLAWARMKPAGEAYDFHDVRGCAFFQFLKARGMPVRVAGGMGHWVDLDGNDHWEDIPAGVLSAEPWTFGAFAERLEKALPA
jgi:hypothetical protein